MSKRFVVDIETNDLLSNLIDYSELPYKLNNDAKLWCIVFRDIDTGDIFHNSLNNITKSWVKSVTKDVTELVGHNGIKFDFLVLKMFGVLDYEIGYLDKPDKLFGRDIKVTDTLIRSRLFHPDRKGGHSLKAWGLRLGEHKGDFTDFHNYSNTMLEYCIQDTHVTTLIYKELEKEYNSYAGWARAEKLENKLADLAVRRETYGFWFNKELAINCVDDLTIKMQKLQDNVNPLLPPKPMGKTAIKAYTPPKIQFKADGSLAASIIKFADKHDAEISGDLFIYKGRSYKLPLTEPIETTELASISDLDHVKSYLISLGWNPSEFKVRDLTKDTKKQSLPYGKRVETLDRWLNQTFDEGKYKYHRLQELGLGTNKAVVREKLLSKLANDKPVRVPTSPTVRVGIEKELCPNLISLGSKVDFANDFTLFLTYKHRKSSIAGGDIEDMDFDDEVPSTGLLAMYRESDGRIPTPAIEIGSNTHRYRHIGVCNVPRVSSIYGSEMRSLFGCGKGMFQLGFDFSSLEARIQGHYIMDFNGADLAKQLLASKPNDIHCYSEDTEILTQNGWKLFGNLTEFDKVAQYDEGLISFVKPLDIVWQEYEGDMYTDPTTNFKVTSNHRVLFKRYTSGANAIVRADEFKPSSDKRYIVGGSKIEGSLNLSDAFIKLLVATQADGCLAKDCSAIQFSFVKDDKIARLEGVLLELGAKYRKSTHFRKGRDETSIRISSGSLTVQVRNFLSECKSFKDELLNLPYNKLKILINEVKYWDGTERSNGDVVLDTTDKTACEFIQTVASLVGYKTNFNSYVKNTSFGVVSVYRVYISTNTLAVKSANKPLEVSHYKGFIGCVSVPSGLVLVKRKGEIVVSGNTINGKKLNITRDQAKSISYMLMYGGSASKAKKMLGISQQEAEDLVQQYWSSVQPLSDLRDKVADAWRKRGREYVVGIDGRKIITRSQHSLLNALFQSGGVICAKYSTVFLFELLESQGLKCNPFEYSSLDVCSMIEYHDELQLAVNPKLVEIKQFENDDECEEFISNWQGDQLGTKSELKNGKPCLALPNIVSRSIIEAIKMADDYVKLKVNLGCDWVVNKDWKGCH